MRAPHQLMALIPSSFKAFHRCNAISLVSLLSYVSAWEEVAMNETVQGTFLRLASLSVNTRSLQTEGLRLRHKVHKKWSPICRNQVFY